MENILSVGCVIMASGLSRRFGSNKLIAPFAGQPLLCRAFSATDTPLFTARIVVTRSEEVRRLCKMQGVPVLVHELPGRNDTIRLGLSALLRQQPELAGCMFLPGDQPLLRLQSTEALIRTFCDTKKRDICRLSFGEDSSSPQIVGSPVLFGRQYFGQLLHLPEGKGGSVILKQVPDAVTFVPAQNRWELADADTPQALAQLEKIALNPYPGEAEH